MNKLSFPHPTEAPYEIWFWQAMRFWMVKMVDDGPWLYYKLTNEPKGSGELKKSLMPTDP